MSATAEEGAVTGEIPNLAARLEQQLAGHRSLQTTQGYIDENPQAKRRVVEMI